MRKQNIICNQLYLKVSMNSEDPSKVLSSFEVETRVIKEFLDIIILCELKGHNELSGYDIALLQKQKFGITLSPGTVYSTMYAMERRGLIDAHSNGKKTTYVLTDLGVKALDNLGRCGMELVDFMKCIFPISMDT
ncbi:MAG TPA: PadR family transcriptional regulator [Candidatus Acidoferrales bacterium]|nr:PadR family transcriptional regulator [Candidatus Acidoferrales bacterium]